MKKRNQIEEESYQGWKKVLQNRDDKIYDGLLKFELLNPNNVQIDDEIACYIDFVGKEYYKFVVKSITKVFRNPIEGYEFISSYGEKMFVGCRAVVKVCRKDKYAL